MANMGITYKLFVSRCFQQAFFPEIVGNSSPCIAYENRTQLLPDFLKGCGQFVYNNIMA